MARDKIKSIVEGSMPGWELVEGPSRFRDSGDGDPAEADQVGPDIDALRSKYLERREAKSDPPPQRQPEPGPHTETRLARVRSKQAMDSAVGPKSVLVDMAKKKVIAAQG